MKRPGVTQPEVQVDGQWVTSFAPDSWGELKHSTRLHGDYEASFKVTMRDPNWRHPALRYGALVEIYLGPVVVWAGTLDEPDWDSGEMKALGASRDGDDAIAFTADEAATTKPNTAIDQAIARGVLPWTRKGNFGTTAVGEEDDAGGLVYVTSILDAWGEENDERWFVDQERQLDSTFAGAEDPSWFILPGSGALGSAADERSDRVFVRYVSSSSGKLATASYPATTPPSGVETAIDLTSRGKMSPAKAANIAEAKWFELSGYSGWSNGLTLVGGQVITEGGIVADLSQIRAGKTMRLLNVPDPRGVAQNLDVVIGETVYDWQEDTIELNPVGLADRTDDAILESVEEVAADARRASGGLLRDGAVLTSASSIGGSASANWSITNFRAYRLGHMRTINVSLDYSGGSSISPGANADITDTTVISGLDSDWRPAFNVNGSFNKSGQTFGTFRVSSGGAIQLQTLHTGTSIASGQSVFLTVTYIVD